jgi:membrane fusion protein, multidrug efflux system
MSVPDHATRDTGGDASKPHGAGPKPATVAGEAPRGRSWARRLVMILLVVGGLVAAAYYLYPRVELALSTVSTDDAYVSTHVTQVAPRITENVLEVHVDNNDFVKKGDLLIVLDDAMEQVRVLQAEAAVEVARKAVDQAVAKAQAAVATARANRWKLAAAIADVDNQIAGLRVAMARWKEAQAAERLAKSEADRYTELARRNAVTKEQADVRLTDYEQSQARTRQALEQIHSLRAALALAEEPGPGKEKDDVPKGWEQQHPNVKAALGQFAVNLAELGVEVPSYYEAPDEFLAEIRRRAPEGNIDKLIAMTIDKSPDVKAARARVRQADAQLAEARLELSYCTIKADIDGVVSNRNVNPGDRVTQGQRLLAVRSLQDVWVDCNFKETQLEPIRIGQPVDLRVDAYPRKIFRGRVTGFSPGTGAATALLPAQNATGNFVKIVQRVPVRVDLNGGNPLDTPLIAGMSVEPRIYIHEKPEGPHAGQRLRGNFPAPWADASAQP